MYMHVGLSSVPKIKEAEIYQRAAYQCWDCGKPRKAVNMQQVSIIYMYTKYLKPQFQLIAW